MRETPLKWPSGRGYGLPEAYASAKKKQVSCTLFARNEDKKSERNEEKAALRSAKGVSRIRLDVNKAKVVAASWTTLSFNRSTILVLLLVGRLQLCINAISMFTLQRPRTNYNNNNQCLMQPKTSFPSGPPLISKYYPSNLSESCR